MRARYTEAPHQEPRFLLPMALPLVVLVGPSVIDKRWKRALWVLFNLLGAIVFGALHQSGVAPATAALPRLAAAASLAGWRRWKIW